MTFSLRTKVALERGRGVMTGISATTKRWIHWLKCDQTNPISFSGEIANYYYNQPSLELRANGLFKEDGR